MQRVRAKWTCISVGLIVPCLLGLQALGRCQLHPGTGRLVAGEHFDFILKKVVLLVLRRKCPCLAQY